MKKYFLFILTALIIGAGVQSAVFAEPVVYNTQTQKVHKVNCQWAKNARKTALKSTAKTHTPAAESAANLAEAKSGRELDC